MNIEFFLKIITLFICNILLSYITVVITQLFTKKILKNKLDFFSKILKTPLFLCVFCISWIVGLKLLSIDATLIEKLEHPLKWIIGLAVIISIYHIIDFISYYIERSLKNSEQSINKNAIPYAKRFLKLTIALIIVLVILQNSGINVTSLLASLGLGGLALAFGAKETLGHLFGGVMIFFDKPFSVGDWIVCNDIEGTVEDIGFRSTKLKTFYDSIITVPNAVISNSSIDNLGRRKARRTRFMLDLVYDTSPEEIEAFVEGIKNIIEANKKTKKDYYQTYFTGYGSSSLQILVNFFLEVQNWDEELLEKQNIYLEILRLSKNLNISFAFPTQTLDIPSIPEKTQNSKSKLPQNELKKKAADFSSSGPLSQPRGLGIFKPPFKK